MSCSLSVCKSGTLLTALSGLVARERGVFSFRGGPRGIDPRTTGRQAANLRIEQATTCTAGRAGIHRVAYALLLAVMVVAPPFMNSSMTYLFCELEAIKVCRSCGTESLFLIQKSVDV